MAVPTIMMLSSDSVAERRERTERLERGRLSVL
jgi:hypothetical protein